MEPVAGIFDSRTTATSAAASLSSAGFRPNQVQLLLPEPGATELPSVLGVSLRPLRWPELSSPQF